MEKMTRQERLQRYKSQCRNAGRNVQLMNHLKDWLQRPYSSLYDKWCFMIDVDDSYMDRQIDD